MTRVLKVSTPNTAFQRLEVLRRSRAKRRRYGEFLIEGVRAINGALAAGWEIRSLCYARGRTLSAWALSVLESARAAARLEIVPELFETISEKTDPPELLAVVAMRPDSLERIRVGTDMVVVVVDRPGNPGNLGTIIRSCDAFGVAGVIATGHGVDVYDPAVIRASVGSFFAVPCIPLPSHREVAAWVAEQRRAFPELTLVGTSAHAAAALRDFRWSTEIVLIVGNETEGMSYAYRQLCDTVVTIPMRGTATSLNAAVATSIVLYEIDSQRRAV
jgi:23S rRNA (uridine2479-2'-O)-methyltransferase